jgi:hypothetical protein
MIEATEDQRVEVCVSTVRDRLWLFGMPIIKRHEERQAGGLLPPGRLMTAAEAALYLGTPNVLWVTQHDFPEPPFESYARPLAAFKRVVWSILGDSRSDRNDLEEVLRIAGEFPNIVGGMMDDFFKNPNREGPVARFTLAQTAEFAQRLHSAPRRMDLWVVLYAHQLGLDTEEHLQRCDVVTFWNWWGREVDELETNLPRFEERAGGRRRLLGCYFADYGEADDSGKGRLSLDRMKHQCECGLRWMKEGRLDGMIFLGNPMCGLGMEAVEWTREWIQEVGSQAL